MKKSVLTFLTTIAILSGLAMVNVRAADSNERQKQQKMKNLVSANAVPIYADNSQGSGLYIQAASVKEIAADDFRILVGEPAKHLTQATFPEVTLVNGSGKSIKSFALAVKSALDKSGSAYILLKSNLAIPPNTTHQVTASEWPQAERVSIQKGGKFVNVLRQPGLDSAKSWLPGAAADLQVTVGFIEFTDGTKWMISRDSDW